MTTIGSSKEEIHVNDIGSAYLHKQHKVAIKQFSKTKVGRAIVLDQHLIDVLFLNDDLDTQQHHVCDKYLGLISKSGSFVSSPALEILFTSQGNYGHEPRGVILIGVQRTIKEEVGTEKEQMFWKLMVNNPKKVNALEIMVVQECANALQNYWYISQQNPVSLFQQSLVNQS
tara:strand:- start:187 stop:702 length:516 start_codon:yes stop_codon:yes gene_type:complete